MVDAVDPVLDLEHDAAVLLDDGREVRVVRPLVLRLDRPRPVLRVAAVHLERLLVRVHVDLDPRPRRVQRRDGPGRPPVVGSGPVHEPAVVYRKGKIGLAHAIAFSSCLHFMGLLVSH